jgi:urease beta subunit
MRPGEVIPGEGAVPGPAVRRRGTVRVRNAGRFPAYIGSHYPLERLSAALELDRHAASGARPDLPAGASARIDPGAEIELTVVWT